MVGPGVVGGICILLALYAFHVLPIDYTGFALMVLRIGLMVAENFHRRVRRDRRRRHRRLRHRHGDADAR